MKLIPVDSLNETQANQIFKNEYIANNKPALLKASCRRWPAFKKWTLEFFAENYGDARLPLSQYHTQPHQKYKDKKRISMSDYVNYVTSLRSEKKVDSTQTYYAAGWHFDKIYPELAQDINTPPFFAGNLIDRIQHIMRYEWMSLFFGHAHSESPLHTDSFFVSTWLTCIRGSKRVRLIPGEISGIGNGLDVFDEQVVSQLTSRGVPIYDVTIEEGDTLFMPSGWWHHVVNNDESIGLSCNFVSENNYLAFEQQVRARILTPLIKLAKLTEEVIGSKPIDFEQTSISEGPLVSCKYVANEKRYIQYMNSQLKYQQAIVQHCERQA